MVAAFLAGYDDFVAIAERYSDSEASVQAKYAAVHGRR